MTRAPSVDRDRAVDRIRHAARRSSSLTDLWAEASQVLARAVPHLDGPCWYTVDPASLLVTSHHQPGMDEIPTEWLVDDVAVEDVNRLVDVVRTPAGVGSLLDATRGHPERSHHYRTQMVPHGATDELVGALRTRGGRVWGGVALYRGEDVPFDRDDMAVLAGIAPVLAEGVRRCLLLAEAEDPDWAVDAPGLVVCTSPREIGWTTPAGDAWLDEMRGQEPAGAPPAAVASVVARVLASPDGVDVAVPVRTSAGRWLGLHGSRLSGDAGHVAVVVERAAPTRLTELLMDVHGLTPREQEVVRLVLAGSTTVEIASRLVISPETVQRHLTHVFERTGVRSRRELVTRVFREHYEPRVRDNEARVSAGHRPRGGPAPP